MEFDKQIIRSLSSDTRVDILKSLARRRKMPTELAKEMGLAASTVSEHLKNLEASRLIKKKETGHKWIYYELTEKGHTLVQPQYTPQFVVVLALGGLIFLAGFTTYLIPYSSYQTNSISQFHSLASAPEIFDSSLKEANNVLSAQQNLTDANNANVLKHADLAKSQNLTEESNTKALKDANNGLPMPKNLTEAWNTKAYKQEAFTVNAYTIILLVLGILLMVGAFFFPKECALEV